MPTRRSRLGRTLAAQYWRRSVSGAWNLLKPQTRARQCKRSVVCGIRGQAAVWPIVRLIRRTIGYGTEVRRTSLASLADAVAHRRGVHAGPGGASQRYEAACVCLSASPVPCLLGDAALAQFVLLHLTALGGRQPAYEFEISRNREIGEARLAKRNQLGFCELLAWMKEDSRHDFIFSKRRPDGKCR